VIHLRDGWLKVQPVSEDIIRVAFGRIEHFSSIRAWRFFH